MAMGSSLRVEFADEAVEDGVGLEFDALAGGGRFVGGGGFLLEFVGGIALGLRGSHEGVFHVVKAAPSPSSAGVATRPKKAVVESPTSQMRQSWSSAK